MKTGKALRQAVAARRVEQAAYAAAETRPPVGVQLGGLTSTMMARSRWQGKSAFPSSQLFADEVEKVLNFAYCNGQYEYYLGHLCGSRSQRDSALAELRVAFYFRRNGFRITAWRPIGEGAKEGEYLLRGPTGVDAFTEVKSPGWEFELSAEEIRKGRQHQEKNLYCEARMVEPSKAVRFAIDKAYGKFAQNVPSLLVVADDLFMSLINGAQQFANMALYDMKSDGYFTNAKYENLGGIGIFSVRSSNTEIWYEMKLFLNPYAKGCALPEDITKGFHGYLPPPPEPKASAIIVVTG